jgi:hypothetical protein
MAEVEEYRCFVGGLSRNTTDQGLEDAFRSFGNVLDAKVITDKETGHLVGLALSILVMSGQWRMQLRAFMERTWMAVT